MTPTNPTKTPSMRELLSEIQRKRQSIAFWEKQANRHRACGETEQATVCELAISERRVAIRKLETEINKLRASVTAVSSPSMRGYSTRPYVIRERR